MIVRSLLVRMAAPLGMAGLLMACGARTLGGSAAPGSDSGVSSEAGAPDGGSTTCVDVEVARSDVSCASDSDCTLSLSGRVCDGRCSCGDTPVNAAASARFQSQIASVTLEACPCAFPGEARCLDGQCTLCGLGPNAPAGCGDAGTATASDGAGPPIADGGEVDTGISMSDGGSCVDLVVSPSDVSCASDSDCTLHSTGEVCGGQCSCGYTPVNTTASARFQSQIASLTFPDCPCAFPGEARCLSGQCARCAGLGPDDPAGCNDAGTGTTDAGAPDTGVSTGDAGTCVDIELSAYDQSCNSASDCIVIQTGEVCSGDCACGDRPVNVSQESRYQQAIRGIATGVCGCPLQLVPTCVGKKCTLPVP